MRARCGAEFQHDLGAAGTRKKSDSRISRRTAATASLKVKNAFGHQVAVPGLSLRDLEKSFAQSVTRRTD